MAIPLEPAPLPPRAGKYPLEADCFDEGIAPTGAPRDPFAAVLDALARQDLPQLRGRVQSDAEAFGLTFGRGRPIAVDPVPRLIEAVEWERLEAGLAQRARALNAFLADAYGEQRIFDEGVVPRRLLETSAGYEPRMRGLLDPELPAATVAGLDLVRDPSGELLVLEDNLRMPSGSAYAAAVRDVVEPALGADVEPRPPVALAPALATVLEGSAALASDGQQSGAWFEHQAVAAALDMPIVEPSQLETSSGRLHARIGTERREIDILYRRLDGDRLSDADGSLTALGELLLPALESGRLRCVNAFGTGLADDKLTHAHVERMIGFYLGEEPLLGSIASIDLGDEEARESAVERIGELVIKPRDSFGGMGVTIMPLAGEEERGRAIAAVRREPGRFVAQDVVSISTHPTVCGERLEPRRVDLRPFVVSRPDGTEVLPGGLTRYAREAGEMVVNSSRGGGCKDTWVMTR
jgi:uncharacterized circularly permuted ATP-grasp superfamily protein